jgi:predicted Fe-S protein YdhL (DUF1289 family)
MVGGMDGLDRTVPQETALVRPMSPCISVCALDASGQCSGCLRTRDEIAGWIRMTPQQQRSLLGVLEERRRARRA